ncbi:MAG: RnfABCDGE type electron transport complex subunit B [Treponema sp.]|jgi:Na+-translocating ferredoxin:NAD+ oxidoreductase RNF subunit RnfB|nr:RnfABCDGE type electron transport complex subunit B [Treponema sp.]
MNIALISQNIVVITALFALVLAFVLGTALGFFRKFFAVPEDPLAGRIREVLPGANCGACGFPGCDNYAAAIAGAQAGITSCTVGGAEVAEKLSAIMGISASVVPAVAVLACQGSNAPVKGAYTGLRTCRGAKLSTGGTKLCSWGCMGFGDCALVCQFGALSMGEDGLPKIDYAKCTGCKLCIGECPQGLIREIPKGRRGAEALCSNRNAIKSMVIKTCKTGCIKCEICVKNCPEQCITMQNSIPVVNDALCTSCGTCVAKCPTKVLKILEKDVVLA